jgi:hypothetical protein
MTALSRQAKIAAKGACDRSLSLGSMSKNVQARSGEPMKSESPKGGSLFIFFFCLTRTGDIKIHSQ